MLHIDELLHLFISVYIYGLTVIVLIIAMFYLACLTFGDEYWETDLLDLLENKKEVSWHDIFYIRVRDPLGLDDQAFFGTMLACGGHNASCRTLTSTTLLAQGLPGRKMT